MSKTISLAGLMMLAALSALAQSSDTTAHSGRHRSRGIIGGFRYDLPDLDEMNRTLNQAGLPDLSDEINGITLGSRFSSAKSRWAGESSFGTAWASTNQGRAVNGAAVTYRDYGFNLRLMYDVSYRARLTKLFPFAGIGINYRVLRTYDDLPGNGNFIQLANGDVKRFRLDGTSIPLEIGLSLEQGVKTRFHNVFIGLRGGYTYHTFQSDWALDGDIIINLPAPSRGVPFAAITIRLQPDPERMAEFRKRARR